MMSPNYEALAKYLVKHPDAVIESEVRDKLKLIDFTSMTDEELDKWNTWLSSKGYELVEYVDKESGLLDSVWINEKHQLAIEKLRTLERQFHSVRQHYHRPKRTVETIADECMAIIMTLHSMVLARQEAA